MEKYKAKRFIDVVIKNDESAKEFFNLKTKNFHKRLPTLVTRDALEHNL